MRIIIETCPKCGADLIDINLCSMPPQSAKMCTACGWTSRKEASDSTDTTDVIRVPYDEKKLNFPFGEEQYSYSNSKISFPFESDACLRCSNHPKNGGSGICNCTIPYMNDGGVSYAG